MALCVWVFFSPLRRSDRPRERVWEAFCFHGPMTRVVSYLTRHLPAAKHRPPGHGDASSHPSAAVPPHLESIMVRVLGVLVEAAPSAERMEACAAVAKASRPEVRTHACTAQRNFPRNFLLFWSC